MTFPNDVERYISELFADRQYPEMSDILCQRVAKFAKSRKFCFVRRILLRKLLAEMQNVDLLSEVKLRFEICRNRYAYMRDDGLVVFDFGAFYTKSGRFMTCVALHEIAHLVLCQQANYGELKKLDEEFFQTVPKTAQSVEISPIEYYATQWSITWMEQVAKIYQIDGLSAEVERERNRLAAAYKVVIKGND